MDTQINLAELSTIQIEAIIAAAQAELASRSAIASPVRVSVDFGSYNFRRYSRPWIARVGSWPVGGKPAMIWGTYVGDDNGGQAEINAMPGDIVRWGQKDNRKPHNSEADWGIVDADGSITECTAAQARAAYKAR